MQFITPKIHGALDYAVAFVLVTAPQLLGFAGASAVISVGAGIGLFVYSLLTDYSAGVRGVISFRLHLIFDTAAAASFLAAPFLFSFVDSARAFYLVLGAAVLLVVACTRRDEMSGEATSARRLQPLGDA